MTIHPLSIHTNSHPKDSLRQLSSRARISTLDRKRLQPMDCVQLFDRSYLVVIPPNNAPISFKFRFDYPTSPAFIYYHLPPGLPETAGEVRIRLTSDSDTSSFDSGTDLIQRQGIWKLSLYTLATDPAYTSLCDLLLRDELVSPATLSACKHICDQQPVLSTRLRHRIILHSISQPFFLDLAKTFFSVFVVSGDKVARCTISEIIRGQFSQGGPFNSVHSQHLNFLLFRFRHITICATARKSQAARNACFTGYRTDQLCGGQC